DAQMAFASVGAPDDLSGAHLVARRRQSCVAVAAASVIAKVRRDRMMAELGQQGGGCAEFAFGDNAGYPSPVHRAALEELGPTPYHRLSWSYLDGLPKWRHLKKVRRSEEATELENGGQLGFDF
ncbi:hypothetical protein ACWDA9_29180, partial [Streptomyces sp. NPDC001193]